MKISDELDISELPIKDVGTLLMVTIAFYEKEIPM